MARGRAIPASASAAAAAALGEAADAPQLLRALRAFAAAAPRKPFPSALASDVARVAGGAKPLLSAPFAGSSALHTPPSFSFTCTGCGSCCRSHAASVLLDPLDLHTMGVGRREGSFAPRLGRFEIEALPPGVFQRNDSPGCRGTIAVSSDWSVFIRHSAGIAPILFLQTAMLGDGADAAPRCSFSRVDEATARKRATPTTPPPLLCSLGPSSMPLACALYPLGDLYTSKLARFFSLDAPSCEGVEGVGSASRTLHDYDRAGRLSERSEAAEWFRRLATAHACSGVPTKTCASASPFASSSAMSASRCAVAAAAAEAAIAM